MMKAILIFLISCYQKFLSPALKQLLGIPRFCPRTPTCSSYAKEMIKSRGVFFGILLSSKRILTCR